MTMVCFIPFSDEGNFDQASFLQQTATWTPDAGSVTAIERSSDDIVEIQITPGNGRSAEPCTVFLSRMPPLPAEEDESPGVLWTDASNDLQRQQSHWIVTTAACDCSLLDQAMLLTRLAAAILQSHSQALGVLWNRHAVKVERRHFLEIFRSLDQDELPLSLWIEMVVVPPAGPPDPNRIGMTTGMDCFELMEIESIGAKDSGEELLARISGMCDYLLRQGPILNDGDTIGETNDERLLVVHRPSAFGRSQTTIQLLYGDEQEAIETLGSPSSPQTTGWLLVCGLLLLAGAGIYGIIYVTSKISNTLLATSETEPKFGTPAEKNSKTTNQATLEPAVTNAPPFSHERKQPKRLRTPVTVARQPDPSAAPSPLRSASTATLSPSPNRLPAAATSQSSTNSGTEFAVPGTDEQGPRKTSPESLESSSLETKLLHGKMAEVGDSLQIKWGNRWWDGEIIGITAERFEVSYDGWGSNWNEWKTDVALRWPSQSTAETDAP